MFCWSLNGRFGRQPAKMIWMQHGDILQFWRLYKHMQYISSQFCTNHCGPTDFIVWIFDLVFPKVLLSFRRIFRLSCTNMEVVSRYYRLQSLFSDDGWIGTACHLGQTWKLFIDLVAHPAWPKWAMQWMWGSKRWAKGSLQSFQCLEVVVRRVRMCGEIRRPSHGRYGTWTVECHSLHFLPFPNTFVTPKSTRLGKDSCHLAPNVQPCGSVTLTYVEIQHFQ